MPADTVATRREKRLAGLRPDMLSNPNYWAAQPVTREEQPPNAK